MKAKLLASLMLAAVAFSASAVVTPGPVFLDNTSQANGAGGIYVVNTSTAAPDGTQVQVFVGGNLQSTSAGNTFSTISTDLGSGNAGYFNGGDAALTGFANGSTQTFTIQAWYGAATYALAQVTPGAMWGTVTWTQAVGTNTGNPISDGTPPSLSNPQVFMNVTAVPEPTTIVLGAMGGLALLVRRRKE